MGILATEYDYATDIAVQKEDACGDGLFAGSERGLATGREEGISIGPKRGLEQGISQDAYQKETARKLIVRGADSTDGGPLHQSPAGDGATIGR